MEWSPSKSHEEYSAISLSGSENPDYVEAKRLRMVKKKVVHHDGKLAYTARIYSNLELYGFDAFQENTKEAVKELKMKQKHGNNSKVMKLINSTGSKIKSNLAVGVSGADRLLASVESAERWKDFFGSLNYKLITSIHCILINDASGSVYYGEAFIANGLFGYYSIDFTQKQPRGLRLFIPYTDIVSITKASKSTTQTPQKKPKQPVIVPLTSKTTKPSVIQIWTVAQEVHQFYGFGPFYDDTFRVLMAAYRSLNPVH